MIQRCEDPKYRKFQDYGGRGIRVCKRWRKRGNRFCGTPGLDAFIADMGPKPSPAHTLEREDTNGNYEPTNCIWALMKQQQRNRRNNHNVRYRGRTQCLAAWAEEMGLNISTVYSRLGYGWTMKAALTTPVRS